MVVTIPHASIIRFVAIHAERYEGYAFWWNGGTLQVMFNLDNRYDDIIALGWHMRIHLEMNFFVPNI